MAGQEPTPGDILQVSGAYWQAFALHAGVNLDLFTILGEEWKSAAEISRQAGTEERATAMLLDALCAMALVHKKEGLYGASEAGRRFLDSRSDRYIGYLILHHHHLAPSWAALDEAVRSGGPVRRRTSGTDDAAWREAFLMGMYTQASLQAADIAGCLDLSGHGRMMDLGGGPGTYAIHFCRRYPDLKAVVFDLPSTRPFAEKTIARFGLSDRIGFMEGNYLIDEIPDRYDLIWMSHILHGEGPQECNRLVAKAAGALVPGGKLLIHEFILNNEMDGPLFPALFSLNMLLGTSGGQAYSEAQLMKMLRDNGMSGISRLDYVGPTDSGIISSVKSASDGGNARQGRQAGEAAG